MSGSAGTTELSPFDAAYDEERLAVLQKSGFLKTKRELAFDRITSLTKQMMKTPIVLVSIVARNHQWFKSCIGLKTDSTSRSVSFCSVCIKTEGPLLVEDAREDIRFKHNPLVTGPPYIVFYAGVPIHFEGTRIGTLCVIDSAPRALTPEELDTLQDLAGMVDSEIKIFQQMRELQSKSVDLMVEKEEKTIIVRALQNDMRNAVQPIIGYANLIASEYPIAKEEAGVILDSAMGVLAFSNNLLDLFKRGTEGLRIVKTPFPAFALAEAMKGVATPDMEEGLASLLLKADKVHVLRVLNNFVTAAKVFGRGERILQASPMAFGRVRCAIKFHGRVPVEKVSRLFTRFSLGKLEAHQTAGLGLYVSKAIAEAHGASIWYEDGEEDSLFCISLEIEGEGGRVSEEKEDEEKSE